MMDRSQAAAFSRPLLVLSTLVALFMFVVLHDSGHQHAAEGAASTHGVSENLGEHHSLALCALLIVGASMNVATRRVRAAPRRASVSRLAILFLRAVGEPRASPEGSRSRFDFCPILA